MLGEHVGSMTGATSNKAVQAVGGMPAMETSGTGQGMLAGQEVQFMATYSAVMQPDGSFYGECPNSGIIMSATGAATFRATGAGNPTPDGGFKFRGVVYFQSQDANLSKLNGKACAYAWDVDPAGTATWEIHEIT